MLVNHPLINQCYCIDRAWKKLGPWRHIGHEWRLLRTLRAQRYDLVINLADQWRSALLTRFTAVLKPNEAMFAEALRLGKRIGMLATFAPSVVTMEAEFAEFARQQQSEATLKTLVVDGAIEQLRQGNADQHNRLVAARAPELEDCDVIMLAHFSTSGALQAVSEKVRTQVLTAPHSAVTALKQRMT